MKISVPPPYLHRLYLQQGLFTDVTAGQADEIDNCCYKILFPGRPELRAMFTNDGLHLMETDLLPSESWFDRLAKWSIERAGDSGDSFDEVRESIMFTSRHGHHPALSDAGIRALFPGDAHLQTAFAYVAELAQRATRTGYCFDPLVLGACPSKEPRGTQNSRA